MWDRETEDRKKKREMELGRVCKRKDCLTLKKARVDPDSRQEIRVSHPK